MDSHSLDCDTFTTFFTSDPTLNFQGQITTGRDAIKATCLYLFKTMPFRKHTITEAYSFGWDTTQVVLTGGVQYGVKSIDEKSREWTEIFVVQTVDEEVKIQSARIFAVGSAIVWEDLQ